MSAHPPEIQALLDRFASNIKDDPPMPPGSMVRSGQSGRRRAVKRCFVGTPNFPEGIEIGTTKILVRNSLGDWKGVQDRSDATGGNWAMLRAYAHGRGWAGKRERLAAQRHRRLEKLERQVHGIATTTATRGEHIGRAIDALERAGVSDAAEAILESVGAKKKPAKKAAKRATKKAPPRLSDIEPVE